MVAHCTPKPKDLLQIPLGKIDFEISKHFASSGVSLTRKISYSHGKIQYYDN